MSLWSTTLSLTFRGSEWEYMVQIGAINQIPNSWSCPCWMQVWFLMIPFYEKNTARGSSCNCKTSFGKLFVPFFSFFLHIHLKEESPNKIIGLNLGHIFILCQSFARSYVWDVEDKTRLVHSVMSIHYFLLSFIYTEDMCSYKSR